MKSLTPFQKRMAAIVAAVVCFVLAAVLDGESAAGLLALAVGLSGWVLPRLGGEPPKAP